MKYLPIALVLLAGCATSPTTPLTEQQALEIYNQRQEQHRIAAIPKCGPTPTKEQFPDKVDLDWAKIMYGICSENGELTSPAIGGPIGAPTLTIISR